MAGCHRIDMISADGTMIELQRSSISPAEIRERERYYCQYTSKFLWIFDARDVYRKGRLDLRNRGRYGNPDYCTFRWRQPRKSAASCSSPVLLDLGSQVLRVGKIHVDAPCGGWGLLKGVLEVQNWIAGVLQA